MSVFTPEEIAYFQSQRLARIATSADGQPHGSAMRTGTVGIGVHILVDGDTGLHARPGLSPPLDLCLELGEIARHDC